MFLLPFVVLFQLAFCARLPSFSSAKAAGNAVRSPLEGNDGRPVTMTSLRGTLREYPTAEERPRGRRSAKPPAHLAEIFEKAFKNSDFALSGDVVFVARRLCHTAFRVKRRELKGKDILKAELTLYKKPLKRTGRRRQRKTVHAIVSVHQVSGNSGSTELIDSRLIRYDSSGWIKFDVTSSLLKWQQCRKCNKGFDVWVESLKPGRRAAKITRRFRFIGGRSKNVDHRPALMIFFTGKSRTE